MLNLGAHYARMMEPHVVDRALLQNSGVIERLRELYAFKVRFSMNPTGVVTVFRVALSNYISIFNGWLVIYIYTYLTRPPVTYPLLDGEVEG